MPRKHEPELMRVAYAAELLGVSGKTMTRMLKDGELTVVGLDPVDHRAKLVRRADVEAILRQATRPPRKGAA
jgi:excisionase family DNA binding protein